MYAKNNQNQLPQFMQKIKISQENTPKKPSSPSVSGPCDFFICLCERKSGDARIYAASRFTPSSNRLRPSAVRPPRFSLSQSCSARRYARTCASASRNILARELSTYLWIVSDKCLNFLFLGIFAVFIIYLLLSSSVLRKILYA